MLDNAPMHFVLTPVGSAGDVLPYLGIGRELVRRGHDVTLVTGEPFRASAQRAGLGFVASWSGEAFDALTHDPDLWHPLRGLRVVLGAVGASLRLTYAALSEVYEPGRSVLVGHTLAFATRTFEEKHGAAAVTVHLAPGALRSEHLMPAPPPGRDLSGAPRWLKRGLWWAADRIIIDRCIEPTLNAWRAELGLPPVRHVFKSWLHSPQAILGLFPDWFGPPQPDWPAHLRLTGFPLFDEDDGAPLEPGLEAFLAGGAPPVAFTPGSANRQAPGFFAAAIAATTALDGRALLLTRFPDQLPGELPASVHHCDWTPLSRILRRCSAIVHHGGIGTCAQALAAGIPQLVMPMAFDQPDNAVRLKRLGVGALLAPRAFSGRRVARALAGLLESTRVRAACQRYREAVQTDDGLAETCSLLEETRHRESPNRHQ